MSTAIDRIVDLDGPVHYREWPGPQTRTFVCLHSVGGSHLHWDAVGPGLARLGRVLALDLPGFGLTARAGRSARLEANQRLVSRFLRTASTGDAIVVGHSMGGAIGILQAASEPQSMAGLVLTSSSLPASRKHAPDRTAFAWYVAHRARMRGRALLRTRGRIPTLERVISDSLRGAAADPTSIDPDVIRSSIELARNAQPARETAAAFAEAARSTFMLLSHGGRFRGLLNHIECPVLLLHGGRDRTVPLEFAQRVSRDHPAWQFAVLPELGHLMQLESSDRWLAAVEGWVQSQTSGPRQRTTPLPA